MGFNSGFKGLKTVLGDDVVNDHVITYVDDLLIHSSSLWKFVGENTTHVWCC